MHVLKVGTEVVGHYAGFTMACSMALERCIRTGVRVDVYLCNARHCPPVLRYFVFYNDGKLTERFPGIDGKEE